MDALIPLYAQLYQLIFIQSQRHKVIFEARKRIIERFYRKHRKLPQKFISITVKFLLAGLSINNQLIYPRPQKSRAKIFIVDN